MSAQTITVTTDSERMVEIPALFVSNVYAVNQRYRFYSDGKEPDRELLKGYNITHLPTGGCLFTFRSKRGAIGFCRWMAKNLPDYDPSCHEDEMRRLAMQRDIDGVAHSFGREYTFRGWVASD